MRPSQNIVLWREESAGTRVEVLDVVSIKSQVLLEPPAGTLRKLHIIWRENALIKLDAIRMLIICSIRLVNLIIDPVIASECILVVLRRLASASVDQLLVEDNAGKAVPNLERSNVRDLDANVLSRSDLVGIACAAVLDFISAIVLGGDSAREHRHLEVVDLDLRDDTIHVVHWERSDS